MPLAAREDALGGDTDEALAQKQQEVHGRHVGPLLACCLRLLVSHEEVQRLLRLRCFSPADVVDDLGPQRVAQLHNLRASPRCRTLEFLRQLLPEVQPPPLRPERWHQLFLLLNLFDQGHPQGFPPLPLQARLPPLLDTLLVLLLLVLHRLILGLGNLQLGTATLVLLCQDPLPHVLDHDLLALVPALRLEGHEGHAARLLGLLVIQDADLPDGREVGEVPFQLVLPQLADLLDEETYAVRRQSVEFLRILLFLLLLLGASASAAIPRVLPTSPPHVRVQCSGLFHLRELLSYPCPRGSQLLAVFELCLPDLEAGQPRQPADELCLALPLPGLEGRSHRVAAADGEEGGHVKPLRQQRLRRNTLPTHGLWRPHRRSAPQRRWAESLAAHAEHREEQPRGL
mmetsp:Transcript_47828/g.123094  ORF Transcript_47828/g.123094 Transcript_47828/m.123094 type:complete len:400 (+) Transcript_47828:958-2157(+)